MIFNPLFIDSEAKQINPVGFGKANNSYLFRDIINVVQNTQSQRVFNSSSILTNILNDVKGLTKTAKDGNSKIDAELNSILQEFNISGGFQTKLNELIETTGKNDSTVILGSTQKITEVLNEVLNKLGVEFNLTVKLPNQSNKTTEEQQPDQLQALLKQIDSQLLEGKPVILQINQSNGEENFTLTIEQVDPKIVSHSSPDSTKQAYSITLEHGTTSSKINFKLDKESSAYKETSSTEKAVLKNFVTEIEKTDGSEFKNKSKLNQASIQVDTDIDKEQKGNNTLANKDASTKQVAETVAGAVNKNTKLAAGKEVIAELKTSKSIENQSQLKSDVNNIKVTTDNSVKIESNNGVELNTNEIEGKATLLKSSTSTETQQTDKTTVIAKGEDKVYPKQVLTDTKPVEQKTKPLVESTNDILKTATKELNIIAKNNIKVTVNSVRKDTLLKNLESDEPQLTEKNHLSTKNVDKVYPKQVLNDTKAIDQKVKTSNENNNDILNTETKETKTVANTSLDNLIFALSKETKKSENVQNRSMIFDNKVDSQIATDNKTNTIVTPSGRTNLKEVSQPNIDKNVDVNYAEKSRDIKPIKTEPIIVELSSKQPKSVEEMDHGLRNDFLNDIQKLANGKRNSFDNIVHKLAKTSNNTDSLIEQLRGGEPMTGEKVIASTKKIDPVKMLDDIVKSDFAMSKKSMLNNVAEPVEKKQNENNDSSKKNKHETSLGNTKEFKPLRNTEEASYKEIDTKKTVEQTRASDDNEKQINKSGHNSTEPATNKFAHTFNNQPVVKEVQQELPANYNAGTVKVNTKELFLPELNTKLIDEISEMAISDKKDKVVINLAPASLGKIKIAIEIIENKVNARLDVENHAAKEMLQHQVEFLKESLSSNGLQLNSLNISLQNSDQKNSKAERDKRKETNTDKVETKEKTGSENRTKTMGYNTYEFIA